MGVIEINALTRDYGKGRGVFDVGFSVERGEVFGFLGPNGAGKTTTIRHLMGFLRPHKGTCSIEGLDCWRERTAIKQSIGYIPGEMSLPQGMSGIGFLKFYGNYRGMKDTRRRDELIDYLELEAGGKLKRMSKGMKQKIGIVAALMHDPEVLILDEPTSGLDPIMQNRFIDLILNERDKGKTILLSSHMFEEIERTCKRVGIIRAGRMVAVDTVDALKSSQVRKYEVTFADEASAKRFAKEGLKIESVDGTHVTVVVQNNFKQLIAVMNAYPVENISAPAAGLEEIFLHYYDEDKRSDADIRANGLNLDSHGHPGAPINQKGGQS